MEAFSSTQLGKVDDRNRVAIPAVFMPGLRDRVLQGSPAGEALEVVVGLGASDALCIYARPQHDQLIALLTERAAKDGRYNIVRRRVLETREVQKLDSQNRVRIPANFVKLNQLIGEVHIVGSDDHLEIISGDEAGNRLVEYKQLVKDLQL